MGTISLTPLRDRIAARRPDRLTPRPITERMNEFSRRLAEKRLPVKDQTSDFWLGAAVPSGSDGAA